MDTPIAMLGYALGSLYGAITLGGPLTWAVLAVFSFNLPKVWHVAVTAAAFMAAFALFMPMSPQQSAFQLAAITLVALFGRLARIFVFRLISEPSHA